MAILRNNGKEINFMEGRLKLPLELDIERETKERNDWATERAALIATTARLAREKAELQSVIADAKIAFAEINSRANTLAKTLEDLKAML